MAKIDDEYFKLLNKILSTGFRYEDSNRSGTYRIQVPSYNFEWDFKDGFPALSTKKLWFTGVVGELLWFLRGDHNIKYLLHNNIHIWDKDAYNYYVKVASINTSDNSIYYNNKDGTYRMYLFDEFLDNIKNSDFLPKMGDYTLGDLGRVYGVQWRFWNGIIDQLQLLLNELKRNPMGTRHLISAWNPTDLSNVALPPCHWSFEILAKPLSKSIDIEGNLPTHSFILKWHQRSVDTFLGLPFNIASYGLLAHIIGKLTNMVPDKIIGDLSNVHIYEPHLTAVKEQLSRDTNKYKECSLEFNNNSYRKNLDYTSLDLNAFLDELFIDDFQLLNYNNYPPIKAEMFALKN